MRRVYGFLNDLIGEQGALITGDGESILPDDLTSRDEVTLFLSGVDVSVLSAIIPVRSEVEARQAVPFIVEDEIAVPVESAHFAFGEAGADLQAPRELHVTSLIEMRAWSNWLAEHPQLQHAKLVAEQSVLNSSEVYQVDDWYVGHINSRMFTLEASMPEEVKLACLQNHIPVHLPKDEFLKLLAQRIESTGVGVDLRQGDFRSSTKINLSSIEPWRLFGALAAALIFVWGINTALDTASFRADKRKVEASIASAYTAVLPDAPTPRDYVQAVSRAVNESDNHDSISFREGSAALYSALREVPGAQLLSLRYDRAGGNLTARVSYSAYGDDAKLKVALLQSHDLEVGLGDARQESSGVAGEIVIRRGRS